MRSVDAPRLNALRVLEAWLHEAIASVRCHAHNLVVLIVFVSAQTPVRTRANDSSRAPCVR